MISFALLPFVAISILDRAGIPAAFLAGMALCQNNTEQQLFLVLCILASFIGDIALFHLGGIYFAKNKSSDKGFSLTTSRSSLYYRVSQISNIVVASPSLWMFFSRIFPLSNQFIAIALGVKKIPVSKVYLSALLGSISWFSLFYFGFGIFQNLHQEYGKLISILLGLSGILFIYISMKKLDSKVFQNN